MQDLKLINVEIAEFVLEVGMKEPDYFIAILAEAGWITFTSQEVPEKVASRLADKVGIVASKHVEMADLAKSCLQEEAGWATTKVVERERKSFEQKIIDSVRY